MNEYRLNMKHNLQSSLLFFLLLLQHSSAFQTKTQQFSHLIFSNQNHVEVSTSSLAQPLQLSFLTPQTILREALSGFIAAVSTLPTSAAYATTIGLNPLVGIWSSIITGAVVGTLAAGPGIIAGAAGVITIPITKLVQQHGSSYMGVTIALAALLEVLVGVFQLGSLVRFFTKPVNAGFVNALAAYIIKAQFKVAFSCPDGSWLPAAPLVCNVVIATISAAVIRLSPSIQTAVPASLLGLSVATAVSLLAGFPVKSLADASGPSIFTATAVPRFNSWMLPSNLLSLRTVKIILPTSFTIAAISIHATLLVRRTALDNPGPNPPLPCPKGSLQDKKEINRLLVALGLANLASSIFGGFGGCGLIPNTLLNTRSGGASWVSSLAYAGSLALCILLLSPVIGRVPVAALAGLMISLAFSIFDYTETTRIFKAALTPDSTKRSLLDLIALVATAVIGFDVDMGLGALVGVAIVQLPRIIPFVRKNLTLPYGDYRI